ncbi:MAG TPA: TetR/AcrR family transcriptional regulator [Gammaproteobacteria bacterium]|nr:TetR/AcrR family transcriptional regulator [Gammaproteobacteria bacterium]
MRTRKQELLDALITYLVQHGLADLSLRPMAAASGTSARLLIFHFGSKENLLAEVLKEMQVRLQRSFGELLAANPAPRRSPLLRIFWDWATSGENYDYHRLLYQLQLLAAQNPKIYGRYLKKISLSWLELIQPALPPVQQTPGFATLYGAVFDGLFIELMSTGDHRRVIAALEQYIQLALTHAGLKDPRKSRPKSPRRPR